jgi:hypothetical protein
MNAHECRAKALECYRIAQNTVDQKIRHTLLNLAVHWRELAIKMDRLNKNASSYASPRHQGNGYDRE